MDRAYQQAVPGSPEPAQESGPTSAEQQGETGTVVYVLHMPGGKTYIGQPRPVEPEPEAGQ
jgi:hypothetical protein